MEMSCRMCAGIADPGVCLLDPAHQRLAVCAENNLNITIAADNGYPTRICTSCADGLRRWLMFRERNEKAQGKFLKVLQPPSDVTVAPSMPQSGGEASPDTCRVAVRTDQTARQPSQATKNIEPVTRPTLLDKWLRPSQTPKLPVVSKTSTNRAVGTNDSQECLAAKFCLKDLRVCVTRLSGEMLASLQQAKTAVRQKKVGCSLPQATETARVTSTRSVGDAETNQRTSSCGQISSSVARKVVCGELPDEDRDTRADVQSTARPGLLPARHKTARRFPGDEEDGRDRAKSREPDDRDKGSRQRSGVGAPCEISLPKLNFNQDGEKKFSCDHCNRIFRNKNSFFYHIRSKHKSTSDLYKCKLCGAAFKFFKELANHKKSSHSLTDLKTISCDQCDEKFKIQSLLKRHIERHHNNGARPYKCTLCDGSYKTKSCLLAHKKFHGENKYFCSVCNQGFKISGSLKKHIKRLHNNGLRPYKCDLCSVASKTKSDLSFHKSIVHSNIKKYVCSFCKKLFKVKSSLNDHIERLHTNGPRLQCDQCTSTSKTRRDLLSHKHNMHSELKFTCDVCKVECKSKLNLRVHIRKFHNKSC